MLHSYVPLNKLVAMAMVRCEEVSVVIISLLHIVLSDSMTSASFLLHTTLGGGIPTNVHSIENS
jgi:hypothetical protein